MKYIVTIKPEEHLNKTLYDYRQLLKEELLKKRGYYSDYSRKPLLTGCDMHEGIITRAMIPKGIWWHRLIFSEVNSILLLPEEHSPQPPSKEWCLGWAIEHYGKDAILEWCNSLPFKVKPFILE